METKKLLLVDDVEMFLIMERSFLSRESFEIHTARSGREAMETAGSIKPDLILLDFHMPDINGDEVCASLRQDPDLRFIPIAIATYEREPEALKRCIDAGADGFIYKPFRREQFLRTIQELLDVAQRQHMRVATRIDGTVSVGDINMNAEIRSLSEGGAFIVMDMLAACGSELDIGFTLPGTDTPVRSRVVVRWSSNFMCEEGEYGMGVEFCLIGDDSRDLIRVFVESELGIRDSVEREAPCE